MPYEKTIFNHLFDDDISMLHKLNITNYISDDKCSKYQNKLDNENKDLWNYCFIYIASSSTLFFNCSGNPFAAKTYLSFS